MAFTNVTPNYELPQWLPTDAPKMGDYNDAFLNIDGFLKDATDDAIVAHNLALGLLVYNGDNLVVHLKSTGNEGVVIPALMYISQNGFKYTSSETTVSLNGRTSVSAVVFNVNTKALTLRTFSSNPPQKDEYIVCVFSYGTMRYCIGDYQVNDTVFRTAVSQTVLDGIDTSFEPNVMFFGDSITSQNPGWVGAFQEIIQCDSVKRYAVSGARLKDSEGTIYDGAPSSSVQINNVLGNQIQRAINEKSANVDPDLIFIAIGTNDGIMDVSLELLQSGYYDSSGIPIPLADMDRKTTIGAFRYAHETLHSMYPKAIIIWCAPISGNNTSRNATTVYQWGLNLKMMCDFASIPFINSKLCGIGSPYYSEFLYDNIHPNADGAKVLGYYNASMAKPYLRYAMLNRNLFEV